LQGPDLPVGVERTPSPRRYRIYASGTVANFGRERRVGSFWPERTRAVSGESTIVPGVMNAPLAVWPMVETCRQAGVTNASMARRLP